VLWLAIDDGSGPRLVGAGAGQCRARVVLDRPRARLRLGLPSGGAAEQAAVGAIWRRTAPPSPAPRPSVTARRCNCSASCYRGAGGWVADWVFVDKGKVLSKWTRPSMPMRAGPWPAAPMARPTR
jgi:hypothetical protein